MGLVLLLVLAACCAAEKVHYCACVNVSRFNLETKEYDTWCVPVLEHFEATRSLYKDEVPKGYVRGGFHPVQIGNVIMGYRVLSRLGNGAFATVWEAEREQTLERVALKLTRADSTHMAEDEIRVLSELPSHPNVVRLIEAGYSESALGSHRVLAMELLHGQNLEQQKATLGLAEARIVARDITRALAHVHAAGWVHTDIVSREREKVLHRLMNVFAES